MNNNSGNVFVKCSGKYFYVCFATTNIKQRVCWSLLDELDIHCMKHGVVETVEDLPDFLLYYNDENNDKIQKLQNDLDNVMEIQSENITKMLNNQTVLSDLYGHTGHLEDQSEYFKKHSRKTRRCCIC